MALSSALIGRFSNFRNGIHCLRTTLCVLERYQEIVKFQCQGIRQNSNSTAIPKNEDWDEEQNKEYERQSQANEIRLRRIKKLFSTVLFGSTLGIVYYAHRKKRIETAENLKDCIRLPIDNDYQGGHQEFYRVPSKRTGKPTYILPGTLVRNGSIRLLEKFEVRPTDVFVASFPKAGTTWVQEIVWLLEHNLDFQKASQTIMETRFPYLEYLYPGIHSVARMEEPRLIKTHLPFDLLPPGITEKAKVIYIVRNPKDTVVSYYHFARMLSLSNYRGTFEDFLEKFKKDQVPYGPYMDHVESFVEREDDPNLLIISYEELSRNPTEAIRKIAIFLNHPLSNEDIALLVNHTKFDKMSTNSSVNYSHWDELGIRNKNETQFLRKGKVGDWRNYFTKESNEHFEIWLQEKNKRNHIFQYELTEVPPQPV